jgi:flagellar protein FliS
MPTYLATPRTAYQKSAAMTASQGQLIVMLYDGAHRYLAQAAICMRDKDIQLAHNKLRRAETIIIHLRASLDFERGGQIATNLQAIYDFAIRHLNAARVDRDAARIDEVDGLLSELRDAWARVAQS